MRNERKSKRGDDSTPKRNVLQDWIQMPNFTTSSIEGNGRARDSSPAPRPLARHPPQRLSPRASGIGTCGAGPLRRLAIGSRTPCLGTRSARTCPSTSRLGSHPAQPRLPGPLLTWRHLFHRSTLATPKSVLLDSITRRSLPALQSPGPGRASRLEWRREVFWRFSHFWVLPISGLHNFGVVVHHIVRGFFPSDILGTRGMW